MLIIAGTLDLPPENRAKLLEAAEPLMRASEAEDGCDAYLMMPDPFDAGRVRIFERWQSEEALATHFTPTAHGRVRRGDGRPRRHRKRPAEVPDLELGAASLTHA